MKPQEYDILKTGSCALLAQKIFVRSVADEEQGSDGIKLLEVDEGIDEVGQSLSSPKAANVDESHA